MSRISTFLNTCGVAIHGAGGIARSSDRFRSRSKCSSSKKEYIPEQRLKITRLYQQLFTVPLCLYSSWCNTEGQRHHERTCIDMDVIVVQAAFPHTFDQQIIRKALILDIGVCIMEEK